MEEREINIDRDLRIDETGLDVEWLNQPSLMFKYSREFARAEREVSRLKEKIKVERAKLSKEVRLNPERYIKGDIKVTEAVYHGIIDTHQTIRDLEAELIEAEYEVTMVKGAVESVKQRKDALQDLVKLHGQNYFAGPKMPRNLEHEVQRKYETARSNASIKIKRTKK